MGLSPAYDRVRVSLRCTDAQLEAMGQALKPGGLILVSRSPLSPFFSYVVLCWCDETCGAFCLGVSAECSFHAGTGRQPAHSRETEYSFRL
jgi:hypothetical protein